MLGKVNYITKDINCQPWELNMMGFDFEDYVVSVIQYALSEYYTKGLTIEQTPRTRDQGKDLIIRSPIEFTLFGKQFTFNCSDTICVYLELKSTKNNKIRLDRFSKNILLANHSKIDYFVLITNSTIVPFSYYETEKNAKENNYIFHLVDQYMLVHFLTQQNAMRGNYAELDSIPEVSISYQINFGKQEDRPYLELYLLFRNNTNSPQICRFQLKSDRNWLLSETKFEILLDKYEGQARRIGIKKEYFEGIDDVVIGLEFNNKIKNIVISGKAVDYEFETPLVGAGHKTLISEIISKVQSNKGLQLISLQGEAGIGKTRIIHEIAKKLAFSGIELLHYICNNNNDAYTIDSIIKYLNSKFPSGHLNYIEELLEIPMNFRRYAIIIEDAHNADNSLFLNIKKLAYSRYTNNPFTIIIAGRDDFTVYNQSYFSFLSWIENGESDLANAYIVRKLADAECQNLIRAIIKGVPEFVVNKIHHASENNPFYVSQFIEYLLETKLIYLVNRNTVGITNVASFSQQLYIPDSIEALLEKRYSILDQMPSGKQLQIFLLALSLYGIEAPQEIYHLFFTDDNYSDISVLYKHHFLKLTFENQITFDHENLFLFLHKKAVSSQFIERVANIINENPSLLELYPELQRAIILFYAGDTVASKHILQPAIDEILKIENISSCNLNPKYLKVYRVIYNLALSQNDIVLQRKTILAWMYVALHNLSVAKGSTVFSQILLLIEKNHRSDNMLLLTAKQMQAHLFLQSNQVSQAKKLLLELSVIERESPELFDDETRFDLFDRLSSVYTRENHKIVAVKYNQLSHKIAEGLQDKKLLTLSKIIAAKIEFYNSTSTALALMSEAKELLKEDMARRIDCHNDLGILTAKLVLDYDSDSLLSTHLNKAQNLLKQATEVEYPEAIIRCHYLLAVISYQLATEKADMEQVEFHLQAGISNSIRNGITKFMPLFYCLSAIKAVKEKQTIKAVYAYFQTMLHHMRQCDQFFLGALDFISPNIILLTNYIIFLYEFGLESEVYQFLSEIRYYGSNISCDFKCDPDRICYYSCQKNMDVFKKNYQRVVNGDLLFVDRRQHYPIKDYHTPFYIPLGV